MRTGTLLGLCTGVAASTQVIPDVTIIKTMKKTNEYNIMIHNNFRVLHALATGLVY
jgi:hypothetical protein